MTFAFRKLFLLTLGLAVLAMAPRADAAILTFSHTTPTATVPFTDTFTLSKFDTTLGTLTGVTVTLSTTVTPEVDVFNSTTSAQNFTNGTASIPVTVTGPSSTSATTTTSFLVPTGVANPGNNPFPGAPVTLSNTTTVAPANFGSFQGVGPGTASFTAAFANGTYSGTSVPGVFFGGSAAAGGTTTITYTFTPVVVGAPEPSSIALVASGLGGFLVVRRVRRRTA